LRPVLADEGKRGKNRKISAPVFGIKGVLKMFVVDFSPMSCTVNPIVGKEREFQTKLPRVTRKKKVLVLGGGPGGMQAAVIAAQKGHEVTLWEKARRWRAVNISGHPTGQTGFREFTYVFEGPGG